MKRSMASKAGGKTRPAVLKWELKSGLSLNCRWENLPAWDLLQALASKVRQLNNERLEPLNQEGPCAFSPLARTRGDFRFCGVTVGIPVLERYSVSISSKGVGDIGARGLYLKVQENVWQRFHWILSQIIKETAAENFQHPQYMIQIDSEAETQFVWRWKRWSPMGRIILTERQVWYKLTASLYTRM